MKRYQFIGWDEFNGVPYIEEQKDGEYIRYSDLTYLDQLKEYLLDHEDDIRLSIDDFGDLLPIFLAVIGRKPKKGD